LFLAHPITPSGLILLIKIFIHYECNKHRLAFFITGNLIQLCIIIIDDELILGACVRMQHTHRKLSSPMDFDNCHAQDMSVLELRRAHPKIIVFWHDIMN